MTALTAESATDYTRRMMETWGYGEISDVSAGPSAEAEGMIDVSFGYKEAGDAYTGMMSVCCLPDGNLYGEW